MAGDEQQTKELPEWIPPGEYMLVGCKAEKGPSGWGPGLRMYIHFRVIDDENYEGTMVKLMCPIPDSGDLRTMSFRTKYCEQWVIANGARPKKNERRSPKVFLNRAFRALVRDRKKCFPNGEPYPPSMGYSVVDTLIEPITGGH
ncbi:MAG: hypothetical protein KOO62_09140 [candidate division Zixibacteria bacterium]|nr:hypothetical protein [candidate division Zixibacteria bacterium]